MSDLDELEFGERVAELLAHESYFGPAVMLWAYGQILRIVGLANKA